MGRPANFLHTKQKGFTLIEVMVALAVVAIALAALSRSMGLTVNNQTALEERIIATWIAQDELVKLQVLPESRTEEKVDVTVLNRNWVTEFSTEATLVSDIKKASMSVTLENQETPSATLVTVIDP